MRRRHDRGRTPGWISYRGGDRRGDPRGDEASGPEAISSPLAIRLARNLNGVIDRHALDQRLVAVKGDVEGDLGPVFPRLQVAHDDALPDDAYDILVQDVAVARGQLRPGWRLLDPAAAVDGTADAAEAQLAEPFGPFARVAWVREAPAGATAWTSEETIGLHVDHTVRRNVQHLIGLQEVQRLLHAVQRDAPELAAEVARTVPLQRLGEVLRRLLQEGVPIRNLHAIFESLVHWAPTEPDNIALTELVRIHLGRYITSRHVGADRRIAAILFESSLLERVQSAVERSPRGNLLLLSPAVPQDVRAQVRRILAAAAGTVVAIASSDVRRYIKTLLEPVAPQLVVLSYQEIDDDVALQPVGWVTDPEAA